MEDERYLAPFYAIMEQAGMVPPPFRQWREALAENYALWPIEGERGSGEMVGGILFVGHTIHIAVLPEWRGRWVRPSLLRAWREWTEIKADMYATPDASNKEAIELIRRLGAKHIRREGDHEVFILKEAPCLQR